MTRSSLSSVAGLINANKEPGMIGLDGFRCSAGLGSGHEIADRTLLVGLGSTSFRSARCLDISRKSDDSPKSALVRKIASTDNVEYLRAISSCPAWSS